MDDPNDVVDLHISRAALRRMVEDAWHDSAARTGDRLLAAADARAAAEAEATGGLSAMVVDWGHIFDEDGIHVERTCHVVMDHGLSRILAMTVVRDGKARDASADEVADLAQSLRDNAVADDPAQWDFEEVVPMPAWALDQIVQRGPAQPS